MTYGEFKSTRRELQLRYADAVDVDGPDTPRAKAAEALITVFCEEHGYRVYRLGKYHAVSVNLESLAWPYLSIIYYADGDVRNTTYNSDVSRMTPAEIRRLAVVKETVDAYVAGTLTALSPSYDDIFT